MLNIPVKNPLAVQLVTVGAGIAAVLVAHFAPSYSELLSQILNVLGIGAVGVGAASITARPSSKPLSIDDTAREPQDRSLRNYSELAELRRFSPLLACMLVALSLTECLGKVEWPKVIECAAPAEPALVQVVASVLAGTGDVKTELEDVARKYGPAAVLCAVQQIAGDLGAPPPDSPAARRSARARGFLAQVQK